MPVVSRDPAIQKRYEELRVSGESHSISEIIATRAFPGLRTDAEFLKGKCNGSQFEHHPGLGDYYRSVAEAHGQSTTGKTYLSSLARFPGDPEAWVDGRGDVEKRCLERGWSCSGGGIDVKLSDREPKPAVRIAEDIVEREVQEYLETHPDERPEDARDKLIPILTGESGREDDDHGISDYDFERSLEATCQAIE